MTRSSQASSLHLKATQKGPERITCDSEPFSVNSDGRQAWQLLYSLDILAVEFICFTVFHNASDF